jgi:hypothetical protein
MSELDSHLQADTTNTTADAADTTDVTDEINLNELVQTNDQIPLSSIMYRLIGDVLQKDTDFITKYTEQNYNQFENEAKTIKGVRLNTRIIEKFVRGFVKVLDFVLTKQNDSSCSQIKTLLLLFKILLPEFKANKELVMPSLIEMTNVCVTNIHVTNIYLKYIGQFLMFITGYFSKLRKYVITPSFITQMNILCNAPFKILLSYWLKIIANCKKESNEITMLEESSLFPQLINVAKIYIRHYKTNTIKNLDFYDVISLLSNIFGKFKLNRYVTELISILNDFCMILLDPTKPEERPDDSETEYSVANEYPVTKMLEFAKNVIMTVDTTDKVEEIYRLPYLNKLIYSTFYSYNLLITLSSCNSFVANDIVSHENTVKDCLNLFCESEDVIGICNLAILFKNLMKLANESAEPIEYIKQTIKTRATYPLMKIHELVSNQIDEPSGFADLYHQLSEFMNLLGFFKM